MRIAATLAIAAALAAAGCGKKGPPLPPLVKLPAAPADFRAERRGNTVDLLFAVPAANTDNTRPANVSRVDVYAMTSRDAPPPDQIVKRGTRVATVAVKAPRNPDVTVDEDDPSAVIEPPEGAGLDQGAPARLSESLDGTALEPAGRADSGAPDNHDRSATGDGPLLPPRQAPLKRTYVAVGFSTRGRRGALSRTVPVPLVAPPPAPSRPTIRYDEQSITVKWTSADGREPIQRKPADGELASNPIGAAPQALGYNVYDAAAQPAPLKLTATPIQESQYSDSRIAWGEERCYIVRTVETIGATAVESDALPPVCETLRDTFPPAAPANLQSSPLEGAINLIWDANREKDLAGYIVLRGPAGGTLVPITETPIQVTTFLDRVPAGVRYTYAVEAVDTAGNASERSHPVEESARE